MQRNTGTVETKRVLRPPYIRAILLTSAAFTVFFFGYGVFGFLKGYAAFGGHGPGACMVFGVGAMAAVISERRQGLYVEDAGVRLVRPFRLRATRVEWQNIARFELRIGPGTVPVNLVRASDQALIAVPTFPRQRKAIDPSRNPWLRGLLTKCEAQVDELNGLLSQHRPTP